MKENNILSFTIFSAILFFLFAIAGYLAAYSNPQGAAKIVEQLNISFGFVEKLSPLLTFLFIFINNAVKALVIMLLGFLFGVVPIFFLVLNGYVAGVVIYVIVSAEGVGKVIAGLLPHGIFELPAIFIAAGYGLWLGIRFYKFLRYNEGMGEAFRFSIKKYIKIVVPLLLLAALAETFLTTFIIDLIR